MACPGHVDSTIQSPTLKSFLGSTHQRGDGGGQFPRFHGLCQVHLKTGEQGAAAILERAKAVKGMAGSP